VIELDPADRLTADAIGPPGKRVFYIQARGGEEVVTILVEKQQVQLLATSILEILAQVGRETGQGPPDEELELEPFDEPLWRAGRLSIGYQDERDLLLLELEELLPDPDESFARDADRVRLWATREQMFALARHAAAVVGRGRPTCEFCGLPIDPEGHGCPAGNGHRTLGTGT
jgi:uncharacterized repeat protein (TIGR03847 family)